MNTVQADQTQRHLFSSFGAAEIHAAAMREAGAVRVRIAAGPRRGQHWVYWRLQAGASAPAPAAVLTPKAAAESAAGVRHFLGRAPRVRPLTKPAKRSAPAAQPEPAAAAPQPATPAGTAAAPVCAKCGRVNAKNPAGRPNCQSAAACERRQRAKADLPPWADQTFSAQVGRLAAEMK